MKVQKIKIFSSATVIILLTIVGFHMNANSADRPSASVCVLKNPPDSSKEWKFYGNQLVRITLQNGNPLPVPAYIGYYLAGSWDFQPVYLFPLETSPVMEYSTFGYTPIPWIFEIRVATDETNALIYGTATWDPY